MILSAFTILHVALSLVAICSGFALAYGLLASKPAAFSTKLFLTSTAATSITGFLFPFHGFTPALGTGILSLIVLLFAALAIYRYRLAGGWRRTFAITAVIALYLNVFVLIVQLFLKVPVLRAIAPTQSEFPFQIAQLSNLLIFATIGIRAATNPKRTLPG
jgi:hypothetical protein